MELKPQDNKLLSYISMGINTLVIAHILYIGQLVNSTSLAVTRFEENIKTLTEQNRNIETKLDTSNTKYTEIDKTVGKLEARVERVEKFQK